MMVAVPADRRLGAMIKVQQVGEPTPPLIRIVQSDPGLPFEEGDGRIYVHHVGYTPIGDLARIVAAHRKGGTIILDRSTEALAVSDKSTTAILEALPRDTRVIVLCQNHDYVRAVAELGDERMSAVFLHSFMRNLYKSYRRSKLAELKQRRAPAARPARLYTCLLNRPRPPKIVVFGWLKANGYLEAGNVSFRGDPDERAAGKYDEMADKTRHHFPSFAAEIDAAMGAEWPYTNFEEDERESFISSVTIPAYDAPASLVVETEMSYSYERFTEKSLKLFMAGHRGLVAGNRGVVGLLSQMGFTLPWFDTSYDTIASPDRRLRAVLDEFARYMALSDAERTDMLEATWPACLDNMDHFVERTEARMAQSIAELAALCGRSRWSAPPPSAAPAAWRKSVRPA